MSRYPVYLLSLRNKGSIVANAKLATTDAKRDIGGSVLGKEYVRVYVEGLENVDSRNKGEELIPRPVSNIRTLIDAIGYVIAWPHFT
uniref:Transposase Tnp1/En/Spm-like domain-containing protein n=1 Tax=Setaria italica TaxID=4555 RepID=K3Z2A6_SETIT